MIQRNTRLIARLDVKGPNLIKGIHLEGLRKLGDPYVFAKKYYTEGIDEIIYIDSVASLYERNNLSDIVAHTAKDIFIPLTVGGGIRSVDDVTKLLRCGADKVAINTAAIRNPKLIYDVSNRFGSQCMVLSIEAKRRPSGEGWEAYIDNGREHTGWDVIDWVKKGTEMGCGEILVTSIDQEGTERGFDIDLVKAITSATTITVIASGGMGKVQHLVDVVHKGGADAVAFASVVHYSKISIKEIRHQARNENLGLRDV